MHEDAAAPARPARRAPDRTLIAVAVLALAGAAHVLVRTSTYGAAIGNDSAGYMARALDFMAGGGALHGVQPPMFPLILAFAGWLSGAEPAECARWIDAAAFGATIWVSGLWLRRRLRSQLLAVIAAAGVAASAPLTDMASWVMADALCVLFVMVFLTQTDAFLGRGAGGGGWRLAAAAAAAGLAAATRFPGAAAILAGVSVLLLDRGRGAAGRLGNAAAFGLLSSAPVAVVVAINLTRGSAFGQRGDMPHRVVDGPGQLVRVLADWAMPAAADVTAAALAMAAVLTAGVTWRLRRPDPVPAGGGRGVFVFAVFIIVYTACTTVAAPLLAVPGVHGRYLVPVYAPLTLAAAFALDRFASRAGGRRAPFAQAAIFAALTAFIAHAGLSARAGLGATRTAIESGYAGSTYNTPYWDDIGLFEHFRQNPDAGPVFSNHPRTFAAAFARIYTRAGRYGGADFTPLLPEGGVGDLERWIDGAPAGAYVVWFRRGGLRRGKSHNSFDGADLRCRRGLRLVTETPDGFVVRVDKGHAPDCRLPAPPEGAAAVRAHFDLYRDGGFLVYSRTPCSREDTRAAFFLHLYPVDTEDLPLHRRKRGYDNLDFRFGKFGMRADGGCAARVPLPDYPAARAATGQFDRGGKIWRAEYAFPTAAP